MRDANDKPCFMLLCMPAWHQKIAVYFLRPAYIHAQVHDEALRKAIRTLLRGMQMSLMMSRKIT